ncbi:MAG: hypothetical protein GC191_02665 [Azospirillum sp.]|nr:hypothetical protein [Azospirillum sp.]
MSVSIISGRLIAVGYSNPDDDGYAPVHSRLTIGDTILENLRVPPEAKSLLVPGQQLTLHVAAGETRLLFAVQRGNLFYDFTATMEAKARRQRYWAVAVVLVLLALSGVMLLGLVIWPFFIAMLFGILHVMRVPAAAEMRRHVREFLANHPLTNLSDTLPGQTA